MITIEVVDWYEGEREVIGIAHSFTEAAAIRYARYEDTDDEADVECYLNGKCVTDLVIKYNPYYEEEV